MTERLQCHFLLSFIGEGNGNPLHCFGLENPSDGRAWWAAVYGDTESETTEVTQQQQQVFIAAQDFSIFSEQGLLCNCSALAFQSCASLDADHRLQGTQAQQLWLTSLVALGHFQSSQTRSQIHILSTGSERKNLWKKFEINHFYMKLGTMAYL